MIIKVEDRVGIYFYASVVLIILTSLFPIIIFFMMCMHIYLHKNILIVILNVPINKGEFKLTRYMCMNCYKTIWLNRGSCPFCDSEKIHFCSR